MSHVLEEKKPVSTAEAVASKPSKTKPVEAVQVERKAENNSEVSELEEALRHEKERSEDYFRRLQYLQADFENYRKRAEKEIGEARKFGNERLLSDLLLVKDELDLAYDKASEGNQNPVLLQGVGMILKRLQTLLTKEGVERIPSVGFKFNPEYHDAALRIPSEEEEGTVVEEIRAGYLLKGRVLRPSIVKVAENESSGEARMVGSVDKGEVEKE